MDLPSGSVGLVAEGCLAEEHPADRDNYKEPYNGNRYGSK